MDMNLYVQLKNLRPPMRLGVLQTLTPREERAIKMYYGFDNRGRVSRQTSGYIQLANYFNVDKVRIIQIISKAERKLRHPSRLGP